MAVQLEPLATGDVVPIFARVGKIYPDGTFDARMRTDWGWTQVTLSPLARGGKAIAEPDFDRVPP